jgi:hypothetical protein
MVRLADLFPYIAYLSELDIGLRRDRGQFGSAWLLLPADCTVRLLWRCSESSQEALE